MFVVKKMIRRGILRDRVLVVATSDVSQRRKSLRWDLLGAPDAKEETLSVTQGDEFVVSVARNSVEPGEPITDEQVQRMAGFNRLWQPVR